MQINRILSSVILFSLLVALFPIPAVAYSQSSAISYLKSQPLSDWSVMALASSNSLSGISLDSLKNDPSNTPTDVERRILALVAAGENPETFGSVNFVQKLSGMWNGTEITSPAATGLINDDIFGLLALAAANREPEKRAALANFLKQNQNSDGGWGFTRAPSNSDSNMTATALMALLASGENPNGEHVNRGYQYLGSTRAQGGYSYDAVSNFGPDGGSTAWAISALRAGGRSVPSEATSYLDSLQRQNGSFAWQASDSAGSVLITAYAVIALNNHFYPVKPAGANANFTIPFSVVHGAQTIFSGHLSLPGSPTVLTALDTASKQGGFTYTTSNTALGIFVESIAGVGPAGQNGWLYAVNNTKPAVSAAAYNLQNNDKVIWYYGGPNDPVPAAANSETRIQVQLAANILPKDEIPPPTVNLTASKTAIKIGEFVKLTWQTQNATRIVSSTPNNWAGADPSLSGEVTLQPAQTTTYVMMVEGAGGSAQNSVTVNVDTTPSVVFGVNTTSVNFGDLKPGQISTEHSVTIRNQGNGKIKITASLNQTDAVYQQGLRIGDTMWNVYQSELDPNFAREAKLQLAVPADYNSTGQKTGTLIFWASPK